MIEPIKWQCTEDNNSAKRLGDVHLKSSITYSRLASSMFQVEMVEQIRTSFHPRPSVLGAKKHDVSITPPHQHAALRCIRAALTLAGVVPKTQKCSKDAEMFL